MIAMLPSMATAAPKSALVVASLAVSLKSSMSVLTSYR